VNAEFEDLLEDVLDERPNLNVQCGTAMRGKDRVKRMKKKVVSNEPKVILGPVHATPEKFENAALFLWLGLPSTLIRHKNGAFRKRSSNRRSLKTPAFRFRVERKHFEHGAF